MVQCLCRCDSLGWVLLKEPLHEMQPLIGENLHVQGRLRYQGDQKLNLQFLFWESTSSYYFPGNGDFLRASKWKMTPTLNKSQIDPYLAFRSLRFTISGATYPGVPHLTNIQLSVAICANPKSAITQSKSPSFLRRIFSGFKSLCIMLLACMTSSPQRMPFMTTLISLGVNLCLDFILSQSCPPSSSSTEIQMEFWDQQIQQSLMRFLWLNFLIICISFMSDSFPNYSLYVPSFENAFTAYFFSSSCFTTRQTEAKLPFPIFFMGLNSSWKPRWLILSASSSLQLRSSSVSLQSMRRSAYWNFQTLMPIGFPSFLSSLPSLSSSNITSKVNLSLMVSPQRLAMMQQSQRQQWAFPRAQSFRVIVKTAYCMGGECYLWVAGRCYTKGSSTFILDFYLQKRNSSHQLNSSANNTSRKYLFIIMPILNHHLPFLYIANSFEVEQFERICSYSLAEFVTLYLCELLLTLLFLSVFLLLSEVSRRLQQTSFHLLVLFFESFKICLKWSVSSETIPLDQMSLIARLDPIQFCLPQMQFKFQSISKLKCSNCYSAQGDYSLRHATESSYFFCRFKSVFGKRTIGQ